MSEADFAKHVLSSIRNELNLLKTHNYIQPHAYEEILRLLPSNIVNNQRDMPNIGGYSSHPPPFPGSMMPGSSPAHSTTSSIPSSTPATVIPPPSYNASSNEHNNNKLGSVEALYDYSGGNPDTDLSFRRGDTIQLTETVNDDWWKGTLHGKNGIFPRSYVKKLEPVVTEKPSYSSPPPPPPPSRQPQQDSYGYSSMSPKQDSYDYPPPPPSQNSSYAPPPQSQSYAPPPQSQSYAPPPPAMSSNYSTQQQYAAPPEQQMANYNAPPPLTSTSSAPAVVEQPHEESKMSGFGKKLAGNVANAATWGFGATIGGNVANSIF
ncbi:hypothetical protein BD770DRAFT_471320 [Pilaira anomala]|nr:hypothetical protein BD770DRAFT_471320 [Pilaira anomala]